MGDVTRNRTVQGAYGELRIQALEDFLNFIKKSLRIIAGMLIDHCRLNIKIYKDIYNSRAAYDYRVGGTLKAVRKEQKIYFECNMPRNHILGDMRFSTDIRIIR